MKLKEKGDAYELDAEGYAEALLQSYVLNTLKKIPKGKVLEIVFDDPETYEPLTLALQEAGHEIIERRAEGGKFTIKIKRS